MLSDIANYVRFSEQISTSGQPTEEQFSTIAGHGFSNIINLAMPTSDLAIAKEGAIVSTLGLSYFHIPVPFDSPEKQHLILFLKLLIAQEDKKVWIHCAKNYRVSAFMYHYQKLTHQLTGKRLETLRFEKWQPNTIWQQFLAIEINVDEI